MRCCKRGTMRFTGRGRAARQVELGVGRSIPQAPPPEASCRAGGRLRHQRGLGGKETPLPPPPAETWEPNPVALGAWPLTASRPVSGMLRAGTTTCSAAREAAGPSSFLGRERGGPSRPCPIAGAIYAPLGGSPLGGTAVGRGQLQAGGGAPAPSCLGGLLRARYQAHLPPMPCSYPTGTLPPHSPSPVLTLHQAQPSFPFHKLPKKRKANPEQSSSSSGARARSQ